MQQICVRVIQLIQIFFFILQMNQSYDLQCPEAVHWKIRAEGKCGHPNKTENYFCLYDNIKRIYTEGCEGPDWDRIGQKLVISGFFTKGNCTKMRYQPFSFWTTGNSECVYIKTECSEKGQITSNHGLSYYDRTCRCDFSLGYNYTQSPKDFCNCRPSIEDCSCVQGKFHDLHGYEALDLKCSKTIVKDHKDTQSIVLNSTTDMQNNIQILTIRRESIVLLTTYMVIVITIIICMIGILFSASVMNTPSNKEQMTCLSNYRDSGMSSVGGGLFYNETVVKEEEAFNEGEINYLRIVHLIFTVACPVVRMVFNEEMNPDFPCQTLVRNKRLLKDTFKRSEQWTKMYPQMKGETISADRFDIKCMINLLKNFKIVSIGDRLPLPNDTKTDALLGRIKFYRTVIVDAVDGRLSDKDFQIYWKDIGQAVLRMASKYLYKINLKKTLKEKLVLLSPIKEDDVMLRKFFLLTERVPQLILQQLIKEYCLETFNDESLIKLLEAEKHNLLHKRKKQSYCCYCDNKTFSYILSDELWNTLYRYDETKQLAHTCKRNERCVLRYDINFNFQIDTACTAMMIPLVLNTPLLRYVVTQMFKKNLQSFLEKSKHVIFHAVESFGNRPCCHCKDGRILKVKTLLTPVEWDNTYTKKKQAICPAEQCCCRFSVKDSFSTNSLDDILLFKIMSITGPFHVFHETKFNPFNTFLNWDGKCDKYIAAIDELLKAVKDAEFVQKIQCELASSESSAGGIEQGYVAKWIFKNKSVEQATSSAKGKFVVILQDGGKLATKEIAVSNKADICLSAKGKIPWTLEETNFLRLYHMLMQIVCPAVKVEFDKHISGRLENIITDIYYKDLEEEYKTEANLAEALKEPLRLSSDQRNRIFLAKQESATSEDLDLALMIRILEEYKNYIESLKDDEILYRCLKTIKDVRKTITRSCNGILTNEDLDEYWDILSEVVIHFRGEGYKPLLLDLKTRRIPQDDE